MIRRWLILAGTALLDVAIVGVVVSLGGPTAAANVFVTVLMVKAVAFVALYGWRSNWSQTSGGRAVMVLMSCIALITLIGTMGAFLGNYPAKPYVRLGAFIAVGVTLVNLLITLIDAQRGPTDRRDS
jgi:hypothetical protein